MTDQPTPPADENSLTPDQEARVEALSTARDMLVSYDDTSPAPVVSELLAVADYVLTGVRIGYTIDEDATRRPVVFALTGNLSQAAIDSFNQALRSPQDESAAAAEPAPEPASPSSSPPAPPVIPAQPTGETRQPPTQPPADPTTDPQA